MRVRMSGAEAGSGSKMRKSVAVVAIAAALGVTGGTAVAVSQMGPSTAVVAGSTQATTSVPGGAPNAAGRTKRSPKHDQLEDVIAALVAKGTITQAQADAITKALADARAAHAPDKGRGEMGRMFGFLRNTEKAVADAIGITPEQLRDELRNGSTIGEVAKAHGVPESKVVDAVVAQAATQIDKAVSDGHLTAEQATKLKDGIRDLANKVVDGKGFGFGDGSGGPGHGDRARPGSKDTPPPTAPATSVTPPASGPTTAPATTAAPPTAPPTTAAVPSTTTD